MAALKTQVMTMFMMKKNDKNDDIFMVVYTMLLMSFVEYIFKYMPQVATFFQTLAMNYINKKKKDIVLPALLAPTNPSKKEEIVYSMTLQRPFNKEKPVSGNINIDKIDAVIDYLCSLNNVKNVKMGSRYSLNTKDEIELTPLLKAKVRESGDLENEKDGLIEIVIYSTVLNIPGIREWIEEVYNNYLFEKNNKLGNSIYYFNEIPVEAPYGINPDTKQKEYRYDNSPKMLMFRMTEFKTSKSFTNIYGNHVNEMKERLDLFINHPEWYIERGIPHSLGILLHGVPGGGKTSTIKAISKDTNRHIFNLSLREYTTQQQLTNLFFNESVVVMNEGNKQTLKIPLNKRVYVIEDIDCLTDVVLDRELYPQSNKVDSEAITLSFLLNLLDGVLETPGRILVITSNYPERLDKAFIRPGRIDVKIEFTYTNRPFILDMVNKFYSNNFNIDVIPEEVDNVFTPAEIMECMCTYFKEPMKAIELMKEKKVLKQKKELQYELKKQMLQAERMRILESSEEKESITDSSTTISVEGNEIVTNKQYKDDEKRRKEISNIPPEIEAEAEEIRKENETIKKEYLKKDLKTIENTNKEIKDGFDANDKYSSYESAFEIFNTNNF